jgi:hypothetical protein
MRRALAALLAALTLVASALPALGQSAEFKGMPNVSRELSSRIAPRDLPFELDWYLPAPGLDYLVGRWSSFGTEHSFHNGSPNALSMVIWHVTLTNFTGQLGHWCTRPPFTFDSHFTATMTKLCSWPSAQAKGEDVMLSFWVALMGFAAPREEYVAWRDFFLTSSYRDKPGRETVAAMALAITMNPYFLLHR